MALRKLLAAHILGSPSGGAGTAAAVTERATAPPSGKGGAKGPCFPSFFRLPPTKGKGKVVGRCPTPCKLFEKSLSKNFYARFARPTSQPSTCHSTPWGVSFITTCMAANWSRMASAVAQSLALRASARFWMSASISAVSSGESSFPAGF